MRKGFVEVMGFNDRWLLIFGIPLATVLVALLMFNQLVHVEPASG